MSKKLAKLLNRPEAEIAKTIAGFEATSGYPSEDVRLLDENNQKLRKKIEQLGLDPNDTSDEELFWALRARFQKDSQSLDRALGVTDSTGFDERLNKAEQLVRLCALTEESWLLKNSSAKKLIGAIPPKQTAKKLHYRSVSSMIKREEIATVFLAAMANESATWHKNLSSAITKLGSSDYELRSIKIIELPLNSMRVKSDPGSYLVLNKLLGVVAITPSPELEKASVLSLTLILLSGLQRLNPDGYSESLHELSPALRWWSDADTLVSDGKHPVSFNLKDLAINQINGHELITSVKHHGAQALWRELTDRYKSITDSISESIPDTEYNFEQLNTTTKLPKAGDLAAEYIPVE